MRSPSLRSAVEAPATDLRSRLASLFRGHVLKDFLEVLLAEGQLADSPDLRIGLEGLLRFRLERATLDGDDIRRRLRVVRDRGPALGAEDTVHCLAGRSDARPALNRPVDRQLVLEDDDHEGWCSS